MPKAIPNIRASTPLQSLASAQISDESSSFGDISLEQICVNLPHNNDQIGCQTDPSSNTMCPQSMLISQELSETSIEMSLELTPELVSEQQNPHNASVGLGKDYSRDYF